MTDRLAEALDRAAARPLIRSVAGELDRVVAEAEQAFAATGEVFQRGTQLVRVVRLDQGGRTYGVARAPGTLVILSVEAAYARVALTGAARWEKYDKRSENWVPCDCPSAVAEGLLAAAGHWPSTRRLAGIVEAPMLRRDGSLLDLPGYDEASALLFDPGGVEFAPVPMQLTRAEALAALDLLLGILAGFPFLDEAARSAVLSEILTPLVRPSLRAAPMFINTAPKMGSGKSLLATVASYIATGRLPAMMSQADDAEAERKRLFALLLEGAGVVVIDNVERPLASDALCTILSEPVFKDRVLGSTRMAEVPTGSTFVATGNNVTAVGDLTTRVLVVTIDPACERPEEREFKVDLHAEVPRRRGELASAALTVIRGYLAAGSPVQKVPSFGRFEDWQAWCRYPLLWLELADPCSTRAAAERRDPVRDSLSALLGAWRDAFGETPTTVAEAVKATGDFSSLSQEARTALADAMRAVAGERDGINARRLGKYIGRHERRIEAGLRFEQAGERKSVALWMVGLAGCAGLQNPPTRECHDSFSMYGETNPRNPPNPLDRPAEDVEPAWNDLDAWRARLRAAADVQAQRSIVLQWAQVAGATVNGRSFVLPDNLPLDMRRPS